MLHQQIFVFGKINYFKTKFTRKTRDDNVFFNKINYFKTKFIRKTRDDNVFFFNKSCL